MVVAVVVVVVVVFGKAGAVPCVVVWCGVVWCRDKARVFLWVVVLRCVALLLRVASLRREKGKLLKGNV